MTYTREFLLPASAGRRPGVRGVLVIIADARSIDDLIAPAAAVRAAGVCRQNMPYATAADNSLLHLFKHTSLWTPTVIHISDVILGWKSTVRLFEVAMYDFLSFCGFGRDPL